MHTKRLLAELLKQVAVVMQRFQAQILPSSARSFAMLFSLVVLASVGWLFKPVQAVQSVSVQTFTSGADGLLVTGPTNTITGNSVAQIGDYNGDGIDDFSVGSMLMTVSGVNRCGLTVIVLGQTGAWPSFDLSTAV